jgi:integrase
VLLKRVTALRQADMLRLTRSCVTERGLELTAGKTGRKMIICWSWALRVNVDAALAVSGEAPPLPNKVAELRRPLFPSRYGTQMSTQGFKTAWQRAMQAYAAAGFDRFWEHDIRAKSASDASSTSRAQELLDHESAATTQRHYRRAPAKVRPLR